MKSITSRNRIIYLISQLCHSLIFTIPIWIVYYQSRISVSQISFLVTFQYISQIVLELPSGALADMIGRRNTNLVGFVIGGLSFFLFPFAKEFWHFIPLALMVGLLDSFRSGSEEALLYDSYKEAGQEEKFNKTYADGNMIYQVGLIISTALGGLLYSVNIHLPYVLYGVSLLIGAMAVYFYKEPRIDSERFTFKNYFNQIVIGSKEVFKNEYTKYISLFYIFVGGIAWASTLYFNEFMMVELGFSDSMRGILSASLRTINVLVIASLLKSDKLFNYKRSILFFPIIMLIAYLPGVWLHSFWGVPFVQAAMIVTTARWIILSPLTNKAFESKYRATAISFLSLLLGFVYIFLTGASSFIVPHYGIKVMYSLLGVITLITVLPITYHLLGIKKIKIKQE